MGQEKLGVPSKELREVGRPFRRTGQCRKALQMAGVWKPSLLSRNRERDNAPRR